MCSKTNCNHYEQETFKVREDCTADGEKETQLALFQDALLKAKAELEQLYDSLAGQDEDKANIFRAHMELLDDEEILEEIQMAIETFLPFSQLQVDSFSCGFFCGCLTTAPY